MNISDEPPYSFQPTAHAVDTLKRWQSEGLVSEPMPCRLPAATADETRRLIYQAEENAHIGIAGFSSDVTRKALRFWIWIAPPFRQKGYATAAASILLGQAWENGFERIETAHPMGSAGASALAERLGLLPEGVQRGAIADTHGRLDVAHWGLLRTDL